MYLSSLLSDLKLDDFQGLLKHYKLVDPEFKVLVDGGAGLGETAEKMIKGVGDDCSIYAFEPNIENVRSFRLNNSNVTLIDSALGKKNGLMNFAISSETKSEGREDNKFLKSGTSFVGKLDPDSSEGYSVNVERLDESLAIRGVDKVDFVKLDLQGGEPDAIRGFGELLHDIKWMWVEYGGQEELLDLLVESGYVLFDTEYLFVGEPNDLIRDLFEVTRQGANSIGKRVFFGFRKHRWEDYEKCFSFGQRHRRVIQTDLVAVNVKHLDIFHKALLSYITDVSYREDCVVPKILRGL